MPTQCRHRNQTLYTYPGPGPVGPGCDAAYEWLWERVWDFSALGGLTSSVFRRVVKLTISHTIQHHCHSKREAMGTKSETLSCS